MKRREFLAGTAAAASLSLTNPQARAKALVNDRIGIAMIGVRGRGNGVLNSFAKRPDVDVRYVCDIDENVLQERRQRPLVLHGELHLLQDLYGGRFRHWCDHQ